MADQQDAQTRQSLIEYPCDFPIKVMGARVDGFAQAVIDVVLRHAPTSILPAPRCGLEQGQLPRGDLHLPRAVAGAGGRDVPRAHRAPDGQGGAVIVKRLGLVEYAPALEAMRVFSPRGADTSDEIWLLQHPPVSYPRPGRQARAPAAEPGQHPAGAHRPRRPDHLSRPRPAGGLPAARPAAAQAQGARAGAPDGAGDHRHPGRLRPRRRTQGWRAGSISPATRSPRSACASATAAAITAWRSTWMPTSRPSAGSTPVATRG